MQENQQQIVPPVAIGKNKFVTWNPTTSTFEEFSIKIADQIEGKNYVELLVRPPVIRGGFLAFKKKIYQLSLHDILRGHFNVTKHYNRPATTNNTTIPEPAASLGGNSTSNTDQQRSQDALRASIDQAADLYFQEQVEQLYNFENS